MLNEISRLIKHLDLNKKRRMMINLGKTDSYVFRNAEDTNLSTYLDIYSHPNSLNQQDNKAMKIADFCDIVVSRLSTNPLLLQQLEIPRTPLSVLEYDWDYVYDSFECQSPIFLDLSPLEIDEQEE